MPAVGGYLASDGKAGIAGDLEAANSPFVVGGEKRTKEREKDRSYTETHRGAVFWLCRPYTYVREGVRTRARDVGCDRTVASKALDDFWRSDAGGYTPSPAGLDAHAIHIGT